MGRRSYHFYFFYFRIGWALFYYNFGATFVFRARRSRFARKTGSARRAAKFKFESRATSYVTSGGTIIYAATITEPHLNCRRTVLIAARKRVMTRESAHLAL